MLNYYDEMKNDIKEALSDYTEVLKNAEDAFEKLEDIFFVSDSVTGNASGSYYFSTFLSRKHCYEYSNVVKTALKDFGYEKELANFKIFVGLVKEGYLNIENMTLNDDILEEVDEDEICYVFNALEEMEDLNFETLDVITRCYMLSEVLTDVLDEILK